MLTPPFSFLSFKACRLGMLGKYEPWLLDEKNGLIDEKALEERSGISHSKRMSGR
jgi:hypothetical protein